MPSARARSSTRKPCAAKTKGTRVTMSRKRKRVSYSHLRPNQSPRGESGAALVGLIRMRRVPRILCPT